MGTPCEWCGRPRTTNRIGRDLCGLNSFKISNYQQSKRAHPFCLHAVKTRPAEAVGFELLYRASVAGPERRAGLKVRWYLRGRRFSTWEKSRRSCTKWKPYKLFVRITCLLLQLTLIGWLPATIWAVYSLSQSKPIRKSNGRCNSAADCEASCRTLASPEPARYSYRQMCVDGLGSWCVCP